MVMHCIEEILRNGLTVLTPLSRANLDSKFRSRWLPQVVIVVSSVHWQDFEVI